ncbi:hypothetical protein QTA56_08645 [Acinetobacter sp. VNH17]|uniref:Lipoprotein n=1 Tax=Acinetobacter thutiue TaxID=2998078 RepID=A0ABT7WNP5_9GAMM|nr:hypothetical protein [Acinetobacter thutiue]MCY6412202.1 hypothetical protein [Acinetobacter thutiue]MDN0014306.1 hypothetical protein [Acinetobacter thutiue]
MKSKILISILFSSLLLTACGGGSTDSNNNDSFQGTEKLDYTKKENIAFISEPVVNLSNEYDNPVINIGTVAHEIYSLIRNADPEKYTVSCQSGTTKINNDGSVSLNNCKNLIIHSTQRSILVFGEDETTILSGTIQSKTSTSSTFERTDLTLTNFNFDLADEIHTVNGNISTTSTSVSPDLNRVLFEANKFTYQFVDKTNKSNNQKYILNDYVLTSNYSDSTGNIENIAKGQLNGNNNGKIFSVNFNSKVPFYDQRSLEHLQPSNAIIEINDINNKQNSISITETVDGQALINAYADGHSVQGFPQTVNWIDFY